jgi:hypothetical protein
MWPPAYLKSDLATGHGYSCVEVKQVSELPGSSWEQIETFAVELDGGLKLVDVSETVGHILYLLNLAVEL